MYPEHNMQAASTRTVSFDAGLQAFFRKIYNTMTAGLAVTGIVAWVTANTPALMQAIYGNPVMAIVVAFAPLAFVFFGFTPRRVATMPVAKLNMLFYAFSAVFGLSLSYIFLAYSGANIARVFFITAAMFAGTSLIGYTTKKDLTGLGGLMIMGALGILIAMIVNMFMKSEMLDFVISVAGVICYTGLVAWDTQNLKESYRSAGAGDANARLALMGALSLYINFIALFQFLLRLMGGNRN